MSWPTAKCFFLNQVKASLIGGLLTAQPPPARFSAIRFSSASLRRQRNAHLQEATGERSLQGEDMGQNPLSTLVRTQKAFEKDYKYSNRVAFPSPKRYLFSVGFDSHFAQSGLLWKRIAASPQRSKFELVRKTCKNSQRAIVFVPLRFQQAVSQGPALRSRFLCLRAAHGTLGTTSETKGTKSHDSQECLVHGTWGIFSHMSPILLI